MATVQETYQMLENATLWETAVECRRILDEATIPHAIIGGVAVALHGYRRNTVDLDLLIRAEDQPRVRQAMEAAGFVWQVERAEFRAPSGTPVQFLLSGQKAGKDTEVNLPDPANPTTVTQLEKLTVLSLAKLIESKLACGLGSLRRTHRDFADVMELISIHQLGRDFARFLHKSLRSTYRKLVEQSRS
jgi:hypothetical protein